MICHLAELCSSDASKRLAWGAADDNVNVVIWCLMMAESAH